MKEFLKTKPRLKNAIHYIIMDPVLARPRWFIRLFRWLYIKRGRASYIYRSARMDVVPFNRFSLGRRSVIESFTAINNGVGEVRIGDNARIGIGSTVIGPVSIGNNVIIAQHVLISGLNHRYQDVTIPICFQGVETKPVIIQDEAWIGGNVVVLAGISIGKHAVVAAGSVVTRDVEPFTLVAGNPARVIKRRNVYTNNWERL